MIVVLPRAFDSILASFLCACGSYQHLPMATAEEIGMDLVWIIMIIWMPLLNVSVFLLSTHWVGRQSTSHIIGDQYAVNSHVIAVGVGANSPELGFVVPTEQPGLASRHQEAEKGRAVYWLIHIWAARIQFLRNPHYVLIQCRVVYI